MSNIPINCYGRGGKTYAGSRDSMQAVGTACMPPNRHYSISITSTSAFKKCHKFYILLFLGNILHEKV